MEGNQLLESKPILIEPNSSKKRSAIGKPMIWLQFVVFLLGLGLLFFVVYKAGFHTLSEILSRIGWGFLIIISLNGARHFLRALCLYLVLPSNHRSFKYRDALSARLGGEAVSFFTFTGPFLGEATKAALLKRDIPLSQSGAAIIIDNLLYYISVILVVLGGIGTLSFTHNYDEKMKLALLCVSGFAILAFTGIVLMLWFRFKPVGFTIRRLLKRNLVPKFLFKRKEAIFELEHNVYEFYLHRRSTFYAVFCVNLSAHVLSVLEVYIALEMLGFAPTLTTAFLIEALTKVINLAFSFIPGAVGVYEGGNGLILNTLGFTTTTGVALALVRRGAILFWTFIGLLILLWRAFLHSKQKLVKEKLEIN